MDTVLDFKSKYSDKIFYSIGKEVKAFSNPTVSTLKRLTEEDKRIQEEVEKNKLAERQSTNSFLRNMIKWVKFDGDWTIVKWFDGKITKVKKQPGETYSKEVGLLWCIAKRVFFQNQNVLFEVMREFVGEDPHEPTAADCCDKEFTNKGTFDKGVMQGYLNDLTIWALDVTDEFDDTEQESDWYNQFSAIRDKMEGELGVSWI